MTELTKQEKIDAAVAVVQANAQYALDNPDGNALRVTEYTEAYHVASALEGRGVLVRQEATGWEAKGRAEKRIVGQAKRLLDEEAAKPDTRILRFSSTDHVALPRLNGHARGLHGQAVGYTTPELYARATAAVEERRAQESADREEFAELLAAAEVAGMPKPIKTTETSITYGAAGLRELLDRLNS